VEFSIRNVPTNKIKEIDAPHISALWFKVYVVNECDCYSPPGRKGGIIPAHYCSLANIVDPPQHENTTKISRLLTTHKH
jgi:hypothetical protein